MALAAFWYRPSLVKDKLKFILCSLPVKTSLILTPKTSDFNIRNFPVFYQLFHKSLNLATFELKEISRVFLGRTLEPGTVDQVYGFRLDGKGHFKHVVKNSADNIASTSFFAFQHCFTEAFGD